ncbi:MAG: type I methionyl aminopeptidase [Bacteroidetes bacterium]|nr:type I methionyl aminopeptidase [Bacteroidota bacterium]
MGMLKTTHEIALLRQSANLVAQTLAEVAKHVFPGQETLVLDRIAEEFIQSHGAEPAFKGYGAPSLSPFPYTLCISVNDVVVHGFPGSYTLREGDLVSIDCGVLLNGYFGDSAYTFGVGDLSPEKIRLCTATYEALQLGISAACPHGTVGDIGFAIQRHCEVQGLGVVRDLVGHGIGSKLHETPQIPNFGRPRKGRRLRKGMTLCVEPMINLGTSDVVIDADGWTVRSADGSDSAHYEHMICINSDGSEILTTFEYIEQHITPPYKMNETLTYG